MVTVRDKTWRFIAQHLQDFKILGHLGTWRRSHLENIGVWTSRVPWWYGGRYCRGQLPSWVDFFLAPSRCKVLRSYLDRDQFGQHLEASWVMGVPLWIWMVFNIFNAKSHSKIWMIWGYPYFRKHPFGFVKDMITSSWGEHLPLASTMRQLRSPLKKGWGGLNKNTWLMVFFPILAYI